MIYCNQNHSKVFLLIILCFLVITTSFSQSKFQSGYYITLDDDTVHGLINNRGDIPNLKSCEFKKNKTTPKEVFSAKEIKGYRFDQGKYYVSKQIQINKKENQVFVEYLVNGISDLYFFRDNNSYMYLIENENGSIYEIFNEEETVYVEGKGEVSKNTYRHIRMMKLAFSDCMEIQPQIENAQLSHKSLINLTKNYHELTCENQDCVVYEKKLDKTKLQIAPIIGLTGSSLRFDNDFYSNFTYDPNNNFTLGFQMNAALTRINEKISIQLDFLYNNNDYYGIYNDYYELYINNDMLQTSLLLKYTFPNGKVSPSLGIGFAPSFILGTDITAVVENIPGSPPQEREINDIYMSTTLLGAVVQAGCNFRVFKNRELFSNFRYTYATGQTSGSSTYVRTTINMYNVSLGFYLSKVE